MPLVTRVSRAVVATVGLVLLVAAYMTFFQKSSTTMPSASMFVGKSGGCGNFEVYRFDATNTTAVHIIFYEQASPLKRGGENLFQIGPGSHLVEIVGFSGPAPDYFCSDMFGGPQPQHRWKAVSGELAVNARDESKDNFTHLVTVRLRNVIFEQVETQSRFTIDKLDLPEIRVGASQG